MPRKLGDGRTGWPWSLAAESWEGTGMPTPAQWREGARRYCNAAEAEATPEISRRLASHAGALTALAETIERHQRMDKIAGEAKRHRHNGRRGSTRRMLDGRPQPTEERMAD
jgi:hypothetical protein